MASYQEDILRGIYYNAVKSEKPFSVAHFFQTYLFTVNATNVKNCIAPCHYKSEEG